MKVFNVLYLSVVFFATGLNCLQSEHVTHLSVIEDIPIDKMSVVYSPLFSQLWKKMRKSLVSGDRLHFYKKTRIEKLFNNQKSPSSAIFPDKIYNYGIFLPYLHENPLQVFKKSLAKKMNYLIDINTLSFKNNDMDAWAYMFLCKKIIFSRNHGFFKTTMNFIPQEGTSISVPSCHLEVTSENIDKISQYISVIQYVNSDNFFLKFSFDRGEEELFLVKCSETLKFKSIIDYILSVYNNVKDSAISHLKIGDSISIPQIFLHSKYSYKELQDNPIQNPSRSGFFFSDVFEEYWIELSCQENVKEKVEEKIDNQMVFMTSNIHQKRFIQSISRKYRLDKPFFLILKLKKRKNPYCIFWVKNTQLFKI